MDLFTDTAPWSKAASRVRIFKLYASVFLDGYLSGSLTDDQIRQVLADISRRHMALAVEWGPLIPQNCGTAVEGFTGNDAQKLATRIQQLGGNLEYIMMDEPLRFGGLYSGQNACNWTPEQVAHNAVQAVNVVRSVFPNIIVGDSELIPDNEESPDWLAKYLDWFSAWQKAYGKPLAFFHADVDRGYPTWRDDVAAVRQATAQAGIPFGMIYNGQLLDLTDADWISDAVNFFIDYELHSTPPGQVIFQSWNNQPKQVLPETDPSSFTYVIDRYFRQRTALSLTASVDQISGALTDSAGQPLSSVPVALQLQPTTGSGVVSTYTITGTVPAGITSAEVEMCINACDGANSTNDMSVYSFTYQDSGSPQSLDFTNKGIGWTIEPGGAQITFPTDANGTPLSIYAPPGAAVHVTSKPLTVVPSSAFILLIKARISPYSTTSGAFGLGFLNPTGHVVSRIKLPFQAGTIDLGTLTTGTDGRFSTAVPVAKTEGFQVQAYYSGTDTLWPALASAVHSATPVIDKSGVMNAADFNIEPMSAATWIAIFGQDLGNYEEWSSANTVSLGGASVAVCGMPAVMSYNSGPARTPDGSTRWQINALLPDGATGKSSCPVVVTVNGIATQPTTIQISPRKMDLFAFQSAAGMLPIVTHTDYTLVGPQAAQLVPATTGETVVGWGTGDCGMPAITVEGKPANVLFSGLVGPGLCQVNFVVPDHLSGANVLTISTSPNTYTLWVSAP
jgi:uncharacterized protein (TIGR03437 family)